MNPIIALAAKQGWSAGNMASLSSAFISCQGLDDKFLAFLIEHAECSE